MEKLIAKYKSKKDGLLHQVTATGNIHERERLLDLFNAYKEVVSDLEAKHRNCSCRTGLKWNQAEHDELLTDKEKLFKED